MNESYRLRQPLNAASDLFIPFKLNRNLKYLETLSLRINQESFYRLYDSPYGVLMGRVTANRGFGIPNVKISIFVPLSSEDEKNNLIKYIYPYKTPSDVNSDGYRYNLLSSKKEYGDTSFYTPTGTLPTKRMLLDNDIYLEIHDKYYKYTTTTNESGDYIIFGVPTGFQYIHADVDVSNIGFFSLRPFDLIASGASANLFNDFSKFSASNDLDSLPQIQSVNTSRQIYPFWGESDSVGLNRLDLKLPINITPTSLITFGTFTDDEKAYISKTCRPTKDLGKNCDLVTLSGKFEILRRIKENSNVTETLVYNNFEIDNDGNIIVPVPLNLERKITDEFGNLIPSPNADTGIPTSALIRMKVSLNDGDSSLKKRTASYLIPNLYNNFVFGDNTPNRDFFKIKWKKIYTVKNYIPRYQLNNNQNNNNFVGFKDSGDCDVNYPIPYNRISKNFSPIYSILCTIVNVLVAIFNVIDVISFDSLKYTCDGVEYNRAADWRDECILPKIAEAFNVVSYEFYNDFLTGSLYFPKFKFKAKFKRKQEALFYRYCAYNCKDYVGSDDPSYVNRCVSANIVDRDAFDSSVSYLTSGDATKNTDRGLIVEYGGNFFYASRNDVAVNSVTAGDIPLNTAVTLKRNLLFATDFQVLGSSVDCDIEGVPQIYQTLEATSYAENENTDFLFQLGGTLNCVGATNIQPDNIYKICQFGVDVLSPDDDNLAAGVFLFDSVNVDERKYIFENFKTYNTVTTFTSSTLTVTDTDGDTIEYVTDITAPISDNKPIRNVSNLFHYFGLLKGKSSLDRLKKTFLS